MIARIRRRDPASSHCRANRHTRHREAGRPCGRPVFVSRGVRGPRQRASETQTGQTSRAAVGHETSVVILTNDPQTVISQAPTISPTGGCSSPHRYLAFLRSIPPLVKVRSRPARCGYGRGRCGVGKARSISDRGVKGVIVEIIGVLIAGLIIGLLGKFVAPGDRDNIPLWLTLLCGIGGVLIGYYVAAALGVEETSGIDWIRWIISIVLAAILVIIAATVTGRRTGRRV